MLFRMNKSVGNRIVENHCSRVLLFAGFRLWIVIFCIAILVIAGTAISAQQEEKICYVEIRKEEGEKRLNLRSTYYKPVYFGDSRIVIDSQ